MNEKWKKKNPQVNVCALFCYFKMYFKLTFHYIIFLLKNSLPTHSVCPSGSFLFFCLLNEPWFSWIWTISFCLTVVPWSILGDSFTAEILVQLGWGMGILKVKVYHSHHFQTQQKIQWVLEYRCTRRDHHHLGFSFICLYLYIIKKLCSCKIPDFLSGLTSQRRLSHQLPLLLDLHAQSAEQLLMRRQLASIALNILKIYGRCSAADIQLSTVGLVYWPLQ